MIDNEKEEAVHDESGKVRMIERINQHLTMISDARRKLDRVDDELRDMSTELRGDLRTCNWCCTNPDIEITIDPMKLDNERCVVNRGVYNNYFCKNCGKKWIELVSGNGGYASISNIERKEIEDYHKGYIKKPKLRCPVCHNAGLSITIVNEDKKTHHYEVNCLNCGWKSDKIEHSWGYLKKKEI